MPARPDRKFGVLDAMILVLASAAGLVVIRELFDPSRHSAIPSTYRTVALGLAASHSLLIACTFALLLMTLRRPRARLRVAFGRPGPAACLSVALGVVVMTVRVVIKDHSMSSGFLLRDFQIRDLYPWLVGRDLRVGFAAIGAWLALAMVGAWRVEASWIDRTGRLLGLGWIAQTALLIALPWFEDALPPL